MTEDQEIYIVIEHRDDKETFILATHDEEKAMWSVFEECKFDSDVYREIRTWRNNQQEGWNMSVATGIIYCVIQNIEDDYNDAGSEVVYIGEDYKMVEFLESLPVPDYITYSVEKWQNGKRLDD